MALMAVKTKEELEEQAIAIEPNAERGLIRTNSFWAELLEHFRRKEDGGVN